LNYKLSFDKLSSFLTVKQWFKVDVIIIDVATAAAAVPISALLSTSALLAQYLDMYSTLWQL